MRTSSNEVRSYAAPAEPTVIGDAEGTTGERLGPARLVVVNGALAGATVALGDDETSIGRARANDMVLPDVSVSRQHAVLRREGHGYVVIDHSSGNGTRINGRSVREARLRNGDEIALGDCVVQFVDAGGIAARSSVAVARVSDAAIRQLRARTWAAIGLPLLALILGAWVGRHRINRMGAELPTPSSEAPSAGRASVEPTETGAAVAPFARGVVVTSRGDVAQTLSLSALSAKARLGRVAARGTAAASARSGATIAVARTETGGEQFQRAAAEANDAYLRGYVAKDIDDEAAREAFRSVIELLPANDPTARKARRWLERLDGKAGEED